jgi:single-stranded-DNA-specific exonuclease
LSPAVTKTWRLLPHDPAAVARLAASLRSPPVVAQLLLNRGVDNLEGARRFLEAPLTGLHEPNLLPGVPEAADRILAAVKAGRKVCVYGDYDVDGLSGSAILLQCLRLLGAHADLYVPRRLEEGYGLNCEALRHIAAAGTSMVVTVDCGIASLDEAAEAKRLGLELIVTDHHEFKRTEEGVLLPDAAVLVHPRLPGTSYPFGGLCGSAVALKLAWALAQRESGGPKVTPRFREFLLDAVAMAALGIVADVVPLQDENRIIVRYGLNRLRRTELPGVRALCEVAGIEAGAEVRASDVGYRLAPRLNAAGRLGCARLVVDLLTTPRREQAVDLARFLDDQNAQRQLLERRLLQEAREMAERDGRLDDPALVLAGQGWHPGVIGIVAGRLAEMYGRPTVMIALPPPTHEPTLLAGGAVAAVVGVGSCRSVADFPLSERLRACSQLLVGHGGHAMAAGLRILAENVGAFREQFCALAAAHFPGGPPPPSLLLDAEAPLSVLTPGLLSDLDKLEPYGAENRPPLLLAAGLEVVGEPRRVGQGERHLSFMVAQSGTKLKAIAFGMADRAEELMSADRACSLAFTPKINEWNGRRYVDLHVRDLQAGAQTRLG